MSEKVLLVEKGQIDKSQRDFLVDKGIVLIEVKDLSKVKMISGSDYFDADIVFLSALETISSNGTSAVKEGFGAKIASKLLAKQQNQKP